MRLVEIAPDFVRSQAGALLTGLQHVASRTGEGTQIPFYKVTSMMNSAGFPFSYKAFLDLLNQVPSLSNIVTAHDETSITVGTQDEAPVDGEEDEDPNKIVDRMSKKAAKKAIK
jgi:hypothetical protein